jgi:ribosome-associated heat shock protein Hsp15
MKDRETKKDTGVRLDKWLWCVRVFKKRADATDACHAGRVKLNGRASKPGHAVKLGDQLEVRIKSTRRHLTVKQLISKRVSADLAAACFEETTVQEAPTTRLPSAFYEPVVWSKGKGRPTKKARRNMDKLRGG